MAQSPDMLHESVITVFKPIIAFGFAAISGAALHVAQAVPSVPPWMEQGAFLALVSCLIYAVITLWRSVQRLILENKTDRDIFHQEVAEGMKARLDEERQERAEQRKALHELSTVLREFKNRSE